MGLVLFISPRNTTSQNKSMLDESKCKALFYGYEVAAAVGLSDHGGTDALHASMICVPSLEDLLQVPQDTKLYPYLKTFEAARDEPCLILHSSGSTRNPKLVTMTHGTFAVTDNDRNMPVPENRKPQNASLFNFEGGGRFYSCFPPYHLAGVHAYIDLPIFSTSATIVFGPSSLPPSGSLVSEILKHLDVCAFYVPPSIIEQWAAEPAAAEQAKKLRFVLYGGGPLSPRIGDWLSQMTDVCQMYGSLEIGQVQLLVPERGNWSYIEFNPFEEADMQLVEGNEQETFELVLHQTDPKFAARRSLWHNFPDVATWRTGDLFVRHSSEPQLWRFHSRIDDLVVLSSSHKIRPLEMETLIQGHPLLSGALVVGQGREEPLLIVEPKADVYSKELDSSNPEPFLDLIWPIIQEANDIAPTYARINRYRVLVARRETPFIRAPKGTIVRKLTIEAYAAAIEAAYGGDEKEQENGDDHDGHESPEVIEREIDDFLLPGMKQFLRMYVQRALPAKAESLGDDDNFFLMGLDSMGCAGLCRSIQHAILGKSKGRAGRKTAQLMRLLYRQPTIAQLAPQLLNHFFRQSLSTQNNANPVAPEIAEHDTKINEVLDEFTTDLPLPKTAVAVTNGTTEITPTASSKVNVAVIGPRGSLGPYVVRELLRNQRVGQIYCLARAVHRDSSNAIGDDPPSVVFMPIDLGKPRLGLSDVHETELLSNCHVFIHNAWKVDFSWTLDSYRPELLRSVRELVDLVSRSHLRSSPRIVFISSTAAVHEWPSRIPNADKAHTVGETHIPEAILEDGPDLSSPFGYAQSKHVAERILARASRVGNIPVTVARIGQIAGQSIDSVFYDGPSMWPDSEWIPSLVAISSASGMIPRDLPPIDWVPVDLAAKVICQLSGLGDTNDSSRESQSSLVNDCELLQVRNIVNPKLTDWATFVAEFQRQRGADRKVKEVNLQEWLDCLARQNLDGLSEANAVTLTSIEPFLQYMGQIVSRGIELQPIFSTEAAMKASNTMASMKAIDRNVLNMWMQQWEI
ncbi:putative secondary metabolism biosynthetic enzyme [Neopestalotiopsis sp. 37M]|nr:putative secondary metabolism biosynthetic enzyme [Neopestalotiopsis sp. 37M]